VKDFSQLVCKTTDVECWDRADIICFGYRVKMEEISIMDKLNWDVSGTSPYNLANDLVSYVRTGGGLHAKIIERVLPFIDRVLVGESVRFIPSALPPLINPVGVHAADNSFAHSPAHIAAAAVLHAVGDLKLDSTRWLKCFNELELFDEQAIDACHQKGRIVQATTLQAATHKRGRSPSPQSVATLACPANKKRMRVELAELVSEVGAA
jgi:hypothetical protein